MNLVLPPAYDAEMIKARELNKILRELAPHIPMARRLCERIDRDPNFVARNIVERTKGILRP